MDHPESSRFRGVSSGSASPRNPLRFGSLCGNISCYELWCGCRKMEMTCVSIGRWGKVVWVIFPSSKSDQNLELMNQRPQVLTSISREQASCIIVSSLTLHPMLKGIRLKPVRELNHMDCLQPSMANDTQPHFKWVLWKQIPAPDVLKFTKTLHLRSKVQVLIVHCKLVAWTWQVYQQKRFCKLLLEVPYIIYINLYSRFD
jgi:hypothetical protein